MAVAAPSKNILIILICPRYSGARNKESAPKVVAKFPDKVKNKMSQNNNIN
jgi:hypothetical protein